MARRGDTDAAFTLVELLVVMIIIAILMAIAIPTFLHQKKGALVTKAKEEMKLLIDVVETCAAQNPNGQVIGERNCTDRDTLLETEPSLRQLGARFRTADDTDSIPLAGELLVADLRQGWGGTDGFSVRAGVLEAASPIGTSVWWEHHFPDGTIDKGCGPAGVGQCPPSGHWD